MSILEIKLFDIIDEFAGCGGAGAGDGTAEGELGAVEYDGAAEIGAEEAGCWLPNGDCGAVNSEDAALSAASS